MIKEKARAMAGKLPTSLWREIVQAAVYLDRAHPEAEARLENAL